MAITPIIMPVTTQTRYGRSRLSARSNARYGKRYGKGWRYKGKKGGFGSMGISKNPLFWAGAVAGWLNLDSMVPAHYTLAASVMPIYGGGIGKVKSIAQGVVMGGILKSIIQKGNSSTSTFGV